MERKRDIVSSRYIFHGYGKDTVGYPAKHSEYSIVCYMDSAGCTSCKLQPQMWKKFISMLYSGNGEEIPVLFFMHPKNREELIALLENSFLTILFVLTRMMRLIV